MVNPLFWRTRYRRIRDSGAAIIVGAGRVSLLALAFILGSAAWHATDAAARHALVIGNGAYPFDPLDNPRNNARAIAGVLSELGFDVLLLEDASLAKFAGGVQRLQASLTQGDSARSSTMPAMACSIAASTTCCRPTSGCARPTSCRARRLRSTRS
jgi:hypothetical protein